MGKRQAALKQECITYVTIIRRGKKQELIPRLCTLRRIAPRYRYILPLHLMKRYQCIIVGGNRGTLTVAITNAEDRHVITSICRHTGCTVFPVLIEPARMRLLLKRAERSQYRKESALRNATLHPLLLHSLLPLLSQNIV